MSATPTAWIAGVGLWGPGLPGWAAGAPALAEPGTRAFDDAGLPQALLMAAADRRRATPGTRLALAVAAEAAAASGLAVDALPAVFASSAGSPEIIDTMCASMAAGDHALSPTQFHNSVHNAAAGYFGIAARNARASTSVAGGDASAGSGLLEAMVQLATDAGPVLFASYDLAYPFPLSEVRAVRGALAVALVLTPEAPAASPVRARLRVSTATAPGPAPDPLPAALHASLRDNPTAALLPLLQALARRRAATVPLPLGGPGWLRVALEPL